MTLAQIEALEERRMIAIRHSRFNAGLIACMVYNANRPAESEPVEVWDFVPGFERSPEDLEREKKTRAVRQGVYVAFTRMKKMSVEQARKEATAMIIRLRDNGTEGADEMVRAVFEEVIKQPLE